MSLTSWLGTTGVAALPRPRQPLLLRNLDALDPRDGSLREQHDLLIHNGRIAALAPTGQISVDGKQLIDATGLTALPGLIDCHAHVCGAYLTGPPRVRDVRWIPRQIAKNLRAMLRGGVTTVRDMAGPLRVSRALRRLAREGLIESPRLLISGPLLTTTGGYPTYVPPLPPPVRAVLGRLRVDVDDPADARQWVDRLAAQQVDVIKAAYTSLEYDDERMPIPLLRAEVLQTITERAHHHGLPVAVHHIWARDLPGLLELPFDTLEHLSIEAEISAREIERIVTRALPVTTTLMTYGIIDYLDELRALLDGDDGRQYESRPRELVSEFVREIQQGTFAVPFIGRRVIETGMTHMCANLARLRQAGVRIGAGTDAGGAITPCGQLAWELRAMLRAGFTPLEAVRAATVEAAQLIGRPDLGLLLPGRPADVVVCRGNPARQLAALQRIELVLRDGRLVPP